MDEVCAAARERLYELLLVPETAGARAESADPELERLRVHVQGCADCRAELQELGGFLRTSQEALQLVPASVERELEARTAAGVGRFLEVVTRDAASGSAPAGAAGRARDPLGTLRQLAPEARLATLKEAVGRVLRRQAPHEAALLNTFWNVAVAQLGGRGGGRSSSPALGAVGGTNTSLTVSRLVAAALRVHQEAGAEHPSPGLPEEALVRELLEELGQG